MGIIHSVNFVRMDITWVVDRATYVKRTVFCVNQILNAQNVRRDTIYSRMEGVSLGLRIV